MFLLLSFFHHSHKKKTHTHFFKRLIYEIQNNLHQLTTHILTLVMWHNRFIENENDAVEAHIPRHRDFKTKKPRHRDSKAKKPRHRETETINPRHRDSKTFFQGTKCHNIGIPRLKNHDIAIPRRKKVTTSSSCWNLTLMPPDTVPRSFDCSGGVPLFRGVPVVFCCCGVVPSFRGCSVVPCSGVPSFIVCH